MITIKVLLSQILLKVIATKLNVPNGVAFNKGTLYIGELHRITRIDKINLNDKKFQLNVVVDDLPDNPWHGKRVIHFGPDNYLYVGVGMPCNTCLPENKHIGTLLRRKTSAKNWQVFASGIRNTVGFDWYPSTGILWFSDNGQDWLGDELPPDEINRAPKMGMNFGFPYVYGDNVPAPQKYAIPKNLEMTKPAWLLPAHVAVVPGNGSFTYDCRLTGYFPIICLALYAWLGCQYQSAKRRRQIIL